MEENKEESVERENSKLRKLAGGIDRLCGGMKGLVGVTGIKVCVEGYEDSKKISYDLVVFKQESQVIHTSDPERAITLGPIRAHDYNSNSPVTVFKINDNIGTVLYDGTSCDRSLAINIDEVDLIERLKGLLEKYRNGEIEYFVKKGYSIFESKKSLEDEVGGGSDGG